ncbi:ThiF family adenylyltransferase [Photobacterium angustum]|uniref:Dinucleotide-utilizing protein n=1 Tax=Photobacterium angustum TaxID=661 RepID=A0A2S7VJC3_PHOAN|nr:ThiF family adenylyltransferase [Photobacterium angustum]PQJ62286.1 dinucleotide-utilizing protein [Photobacterium angustum]
MNNTNNYEHSLLFSRMLGIINEDELKVLENKKIAVPGAGGVGFTHAETLVRMGVGAINIADFDTFGPENMNRQFGCTISTIGQEKVSILNERLNDINPNIKTQTFEGISYENIDDFLDGVDLVCDAMDYFVIEPRILMYKRAREKGIPVIVSGPVGFGASLHVFSPDGMSFEEFFDLKASDTTDEKLLKFGIGLTPSELYLDYQPSACLNFNTKKVSSISSSCLLASSLTGSASLLQLLGSQSFKAVPYCYQLDLRSFKFEEVLFRKK